MTNYEKVKEMSIDEMARKFRGFCDCCVYADVDCYVIEVINCEDGFRKWLEKEAEE